MKLKLIIGVLFFSLYNSQALSQSEGIGDIVPFRKGNKWGLVYHSGKEFYPPVLDGVVPNTPDASFYFTDNNGKASFVVLKGGIQYRLTNAKKLIPLKEPVDDFPPPPEIMEESQMISQASGTIGTDDSFIVVEKFRPSSRDSFEVKVCQGKSSIMFFYKGQWLKQFECDRIVERLYDQLFSWDFIVEKDGKKALIDFSRSDFVVPYLYDEMKYAYPGHFFVVAVEGKWGVLNAERNTIVIPVQNEYINYFHRGGEEQYFFGIQNSSNNYSLVKIENTDSLVTVKAALDHLPAHYFTRDKNSNGLDYFVISSKGKEGVINDKGVVLVEMIYDKVRSPLSVNYSADIGRFLLLKQGEKTGWIDFASGITVKPQYEMHGSVFELMKQVNGRPLYIFMVEKNGVTFYCDILGKEFYRR